MKLPDDAFERYVALGPDKSYQLLADKLGVDKRSVTRLAAKERWVERLSKVQEEARAATDKMGPRTMGHTSEVARCRLRVTSRAAASAPGGSAAKSSESRGLS